MNRRMFGRLPSATFVLSMAVTLWPGCSEKKVSSQLPTCSRCHGSEDNPAPPRSVSGAKYAVDLGVGAHQTHLKDGFLRSALNCSECHVVPASEHDQGHIDDPPAEVTFGPLATSDNATPAWNRQSATCSNTYCHGATLGGGSNTEPNWTVVDGTQAACGACHGIPPPEPHPQNNDCKGCHPHTVDDRLAILVETGHHINGVVEVEASCSTCHGNDRNPAPPVSVAGGSDTSEIEVGAHQSHLADGAIRKAVPCGECHLVPTSSEDAGHIDASPAELTWGVLAVTEGSNPVWDRGTATCSDNYCHGATLGGGTNKTPQWTTVDGSQAACGTCHGAPPPAPHPDNNDCNSCHPGTVDGSGSIDVNGGLHINGTVEVAGAGCTTCHGNSGNGDPAPPVGTNGETLTSEPAVGAHQQHLAAGTWHRDVQCTDCHTVPTSANHPNGAVDFDWGGPSNADGASSTYTAGTATCSGTYCHGTTLRGPNTSGSVNREPVWTVVDGTYNECGTTCHTNPPGDGHTSNPACENCHGAVISFYDQATPASSAWADPTLHVDGTVQVTTYHDLPGWTAPSGGADHHGSNYFMTNQQQDEHNIACTMCHGANLDGGSSGVSCNNPTCHGAQNWTACSFCHGTPPSQFNPPLGVADETGTDTMAVGRHTAHLTASATHTAFACDSCHTVPSAGDVSHAIDYVPSVSLATPGHHGDVFFTGGAVGMVFDVNATQGNPVTARGTCVGACHSDGNGGQPAVIPYWAGGTWNAGDCDNCHRTSNINTGRHNNHRGGIACSDCHPAADSSGHMNGQKDYTGSLPLIPPGGPCGPDPTCSGTCHGKDHNDECWD